MMKLWRLALVACCVGAWGFASAETVTVLPDSLQVEAQQRDDYNWMERHAEVLALHQHVKPEIVFIGDSITHHWGGLPKGKRVVAQGAWDALFQGKRVSNLGFGFDYVDNAYYRVLHGELDCIAPRLIIIHIGTNNLGHRGDTPEACAANVAALLALVREKQPKAKILLLGIYPRREARLAAPIQQTNALLKALADGKTVRFAAVGDVLAGANGLANPAYFRDVVHPNAKGYARLAEALKPWVND